MRNKRFWLLPIALLPLGVKANYLWNAWRFSPLDRWDWIFLLIAAALAVVNRKRIRGWISGPDWRGLWFAAASLGIWAGGLWRHVNTVQTVGGILFFFSMLFVLGGVRLFSGMLPVLLIALLGCPNSTYWSEYHLRISIGIVPLGGLLFKFCIAAALSAYFLLVRRVYRLETLLFLLGTLFLFGILYSRVERAEYGRPLRIDTGKREVGDLLAYPEPLSPQEKRFFAGHDAGRFSYFGKDELVQLLAVEVTGSIHQIHPAELCLKSVNCDVLSAWEKKVSLGGRKTLAVQELVAVFPSGQKVLVYVWYAGRDWSTGNFVAFRRGWRPGRQWVAYQLSTPLGESREAAEKRLDSFLKQAAYLPTDVAAGNQ